VHLVIDIGNTSAKIAVFSQGEMKDMIRCSNQSLELDTFCQIYPIRKGIWASVISLSEEVQQQLQQLPFPKAVQTITNTKRLKNPLRPVLKTERGS
jgi:type III pantothenate kinase